MPNLNKSINRSINPSLIKEISLIYETKESKVSEAVNIIIPSLLGILMKKKNKFSLIEDLFIEAEKTHILSDQKQLLTANSDSEELKIGESFLQFLVGDEFLFFSDRIAEKIQISEKPVKRLISVITPVIVAYIGDKFINENWTKQQLFDDLEKEKSYYQIIIPQDLIITFNLWPALNAAPRKKRKKVYKPSRFIRVICLVLLFLLILIWRYCNEGSIQTIPVFQ